MGLDGKPAKPWRVQRAGSIHEDFPSLLAAYEAVFSLTGLGFKVKVWHWKPHTDASGGTWGLFEIVTP